MFRSIFLLIAIACCSCAKKHTLDFSISGSLVKEVGEIGARVYTGTTIEASHLVIDNSLVHFIDPDYTGAIARIPNIDGMNLPDLRFPYTFSSEGVFYHIGQEISGTTFYIYTSKDSVLWTFVGTWKSPYPHTWNVAMEVASGKIHLLAEAGNKQDQSDVRLAHFICTDLDTCQEVASIEGGGNAQIDIDSSGTLFAIFGDITSGDWQVNYATYAQGEWTKRPDVLSVTSPKHIADPHLTRLSDGKYYLTFSYDQLYTVSVEFN